jgi:23S rRNA maturation-related 3'-5' exoribonuclease YhaM
MSTTLTDTDELLEHTAAIAKSYRNLEIMDRAAILHGYMQLTRLDPANDEYRKSLDDAAARLREAVSEFHIR